MRLPGTPGRSAQVYQENAHDARREYGPSAEAQGRVGAMSKKHLGSSIDDFLK
jgi:hypothetical protein